jgi:hypothetical protein
VTRQGKGSQIADTLGLQMSIQEQELKNHLSLATNLGLLLGLSKADLQKRIAELYDQAQEKNQ